MSLNFVRLPRQKGSLGSSMVGLVMLMMSIAAQAQPDRLSKSFAEITKRVEPAVVSIDAKGAAPQQPTAKATPVPGASDDVMEFLRRQMAQRPVHSVGSGFIVDKTGFIVTNGHVIDEGVRITVKLDSGEEYVARVIGTDEETDLAVLKIDAKGDLPFVKFGDSEKSEVGDWVLAIGSPFGLSKTVTAGIISTTRRETPYATVFQRFIQTDAAINRGNSGGPLVNLDGEVIGVNSQIATTTGDSNGIGFALPSREAENVYNQIVRSGKVRRGYLGVGLDSVKSEYAAVYGLKDGRGAIVVEMRDKQGPGAVAGLQVGDVINQFNGQRVDSAADLIGHVAATQPDETVTLGVLRENGTNLDAKSLTVKLGERPIKRSAFDDDNSERRPLNIGEKPDPKPFGLTLNELTPILVDKYKLGVEKGLVVREINPESFIADVKNSVGGDALVEGDLIQRINRVSVKDLKTFNDIVSKLKVGDAVVLHVRAFNPQPGPSIMKIVQFTVR